jgi:hypothetical protein
MNMEFTLAPYTRVSIRSYLEHESPEQLATALAKAVPPNVPSQTVLRWANGVLFAATNFLPTDSVSKEYLAGHLLWDHVDFAIMPEFRDVIQLPEKPLFTIGVIDLSKHSLFGPFADWIRNNLTRKSQK